VQNDPEISGTSFRRSLQFALDHPVHVPRWPPVRNGVHCSIKSRGNRIKEHTRTQVEHVVAHATLRLLLRMIWGHLHDAIALHISNEIMQPKSTDSTMLMLYNWELHYPWKGLWLHSSEVMHGALLWDALGVHHCEYRACVESPDEYTEVRHEYPGLVPATKWLKQIQISRARTYDTWFSLMLPTRNDLQ